MTLQLWGDPTTVHIHCPLIRLCHWFCSEWGWSNWQDIGASDLHWSNLSQYQMCTGQLWPKHCGPTSSICIVLCRYYIHPRDCREVYWYDYFPKKHLSIPKLPLRLSIPTVGSLFVHFYLLGLRFFQEFWCPWIFFRVPSEKAWVVYCSPLPVTCICLISLLKWAMDN